MQTKKEVVKKVREMLKRDALNQTIIKEVQRLYDSGGVDPENFEDDFVLPKVLLHVALMNEAWQYKPFNEIGHKAVRNLNHF